MYFTVEGREKRRNEYVCFFVLCKIDRSVTYPYENNK